MGNVATPRTISGFVKADPSSALAWLLKSALTLLKSDRKRQMYTGCCMYPVSLLMEQRNPVTNQTRGPIKLLERLKRMTYD